MAAASSPEARGLGRGAFSCAGSLAGDALVGQSRSPNIHVVPFHMFGIVSHCAIITLSSRRAVFTIFDFKKCRDLEIGVKGH